MASLTQWTWVWYTVQHSCDLECCGAVVCPLVAYPVPVISPVGSVGPGAGVSPMVNGRGNGRSNIKPREDLAGFLPHENYV